MTNYPDVNPKKGEDSVTLKETLWDMAAFITFLKNVMTKFGSFLVDSKPTFFF